jgi:hypothetical protein
MLFLPASNDTANPCRGIEELQAKRPPLPNALFVAVLALNVIGTFLFLASIPVLYIYRKDARFVRIRPFPLSAMFMICAVPYLQASMLPAHVTGFPCALMLFLHILGYAVATSITCVRALVFVVETQYVVQVAKEGSIIRDMASSSASVSTTEAGDMQLTFPHLLYQVLMVGYCFKNIETVSLQVLSNLRNRYVAIFLLFFIPPFLIFVIGVLSVPAYRGGCSDCSITLEFYLTALAFPTMCVPFILRYIYIGLTYRQDPQEVLKELLLLILTAPMWSFVGYSLDVADPGNVALERRFYYQIVTCMCVFVFWVQVVLVQVIEAYQQRRAVEERSDSIQPAVERRTFLEECAADAALKREFYAYLGRRYAIELLKFVDDVGSYKQQFESHNDVWRRKKAQELINTYIKNGSPQEVNISYIQREAVLRANMEVSQHIFNLFDEAAAEVTQRMLGALWVDFKNSRRAVQKQLTEQQVAVANSSIL